MLKFKNNKNKEYITINYLREFMTLRSFVLVQMCVLMYLGRYAIKTILLRFDQNGRNVCQLKPFNIGAHNLYFILL